MLQRLHFCWPSSSLGPVRPGRDSSGDEVLEVFYFCIFIVLISETWTNPPSALIRYVYIFLSNFGKFLTCPVILTIKLSNNDSGLREVLTSKRQPKPVILFFEFCTHIFLVKLLTLIYVQYYFRNAFFVVLYFYTLCR